MAIMGRNYSFGALTDVHYVKSGGSPTEDLKRH